MDETLIQKIAESSGISKEVINKKLSERALSQGKVPSNVQLEDLRELMVDLLQEVFVEIKEGEHPNIEIKA